MVTRVPSRMITTTGVTAGSYTAADITVNSSGQITGANSNSVVASGGGGPKITTIVVTDSSYNNLDDTAVDTSGGYIKITGTGFVTGCQVLVGTTSASSVTFISATEVRAQLSATAAGTYIIYLVNPDGGTAIRVNGVTFSASPSWVTGTSQEGYQDAAISIQFSATDAITYSLQAGSSLPPGLTLSNVGLLSGTVTGLANDTLYTFTVVATDIELQDSPRTFTVNILVNDPYFKLTTLLLSGSAVSANTVVRDSSTNNFNLTVFGDARASNYTPYGTGYSLYTNGSSSYAYLTYSSSRSIGTNDFSIECWINVVRQPANYTRIWSHQSNWGLAGSVGIELAFGTVDSLIQTLIDGNSTTYYDVTASGADNVALYKNRWCHTLVTRQSGILRLFLNGLLKGAVSGATTNINGTSNTSFGTNSQLGGDLTETFISNFRMVIGSVPTIYQTNSTTVNAQIFTPPTSKLTSSSQGATVGDVKLLLFQDNRFIENISNATIVLVSNPAISHNNPFYTQIENGSAYFDGTGDYIDIASNAYWNFGDGTDFTIELWAYTNNLATQYIIWSNAGTNSSGYNNAYIYTNGTIGIGKAGVNEITSAASTWVSAQWNHLAFVRNGSNLTIFYNGVSVASTASASTYLNNATAALSIGRNYQTSVAYFTGYISNYRVVKGTAVYTANFTPSTSPLIAIANTQLLTLQYDQPHNNHTFLDSSSNQFLITRNGNATQGTFSPFSQAGWSSYFNGSDAYLSYTQAGSTYPSQLSFLNGASATGTIECWVYPLSSSQGTNPAEAPAIIAVGDTYFSLNVTTTNKARFYWYTTVVNNLDSTASVPFNAWTHIAAVRNGASVTLYINGASSGSIAYTGWNWASGANGSQLKIGYHAPYSTARYFNGYISNLRIINGTALYTANFTPATSSLTAITNTSLLVCHSNRFVDSSVSNTVFTVSGTPRVQAFSPFAPTAVYNPAVHGGSAYFDGTGDYVTTSYTANWSTAGIYTFEFWMYPISLAGTGAAWIASVGTGGTGNLVFYVYHASATNSQSLCLGINGTNEIRSTNNIITTGTWYHAAYTYDGTTTRIYLDGVQVGSGTTAVYPNNSGTFNIGGGSGVASPSSLFNGYISNVRLTRGIVLYPNGTTFTPPTAPVTATTNISLLLNFTDAAIIDSTGRNVLETVADAKTSSVITKFTGGSMYFDGSDYMQFPVSDNFYFYGSNFTIEGWFYANNVPAGYTYLVSVWGVVGQADTTYSEFVLRYNSNNLEIVLQPTSGASLTVITGSGNGITSSSWQHLVAVRNGNNVSLYINGASVASTTYTQTLNSPVSKLVIGAQLSGGAGATYFTGYISDLRITRGHARYTANFTPPTVAHRLR